MSAETIEQRIQRVQALRLKRMAWGFANHGCTTLAVVGLYLGGFLPLAPAMVFLASSILIGTVLVLMLQFGINLRFRDPSMTMTQILWPIVPTLYVMFFVALPQGRIVFLLLGAGGLMFGTLALNRRQMLTIAWLYWLGYLGLVVLLTWRKPEYVYWPLEAVTLFAYGSVLSIVAYLGSFISNLRQELGIRNRDLKHANLELVELATRDPLTSLPNRRTVMEQFEKEVARSERQSAGPKALGISVLDIDHFKRINDTYGHQAGDEILRKVSQTIEAAIRKGDYIGRIGGEEFLIIFPETTPEMTVPAADRIRRAVEALRFEALPEGYRVTVSQGVALHQTGETLESTFKRADEALYQAKNGGRNQVLAA
ncbi:GGDEF domain-containing protein [Marinobacter zhanjiangensis]|uniref:diguanylate cyclase n=1 Tax=Marinobacter zhanjiangensis TaxID=578215 RepID=A0ABQ3AKN4_9GAMM|nr:GGDEF domain-containing protein [Marinobacter zhanjiangensis]GGY60180.1 GGDEF domain-containing protein [Marinobacter zhanjiangensis]